MLIGYARVSTDEQDPKTQIEALNKAGCKKIFYEKASGSSWQRKELLKMLDHAKHEDIIVVWKLDRLSRSLKDLLYIVEKLENLGVGFKSITESIDTTSPAGKMLMHMIGSFAEYERAMIRERTINGMIQARKDGRVGGRPCRLTKLQQQEIVSSINSGKYNAAQAARLFNVSPPTICRLLKREKQKPLVEAIENDVYHDVIEIRKKIAKLKKRYPKKRIKESIL